MSEFICGRVTMSAERWVVFTVMRLCVFLQCRIEYMQIQHDYCCLSCFCVFTDIYKALKNYLIINNCISVVYTNGELL